MSEQRRYGDDEVREIFGLATRGKSTETPAVSDAQGLTLADMEDIGREVGLDPAAVARVAATCCATRFCPT